MKFFIASIAFILFSTLLMAADTCPTTATPLVSGVPNIQSGAVSSADDVDYFEFSIPSAGIVTISYISTNLISFDAGSTGCDSNDILSKANALIGSRG